MNSNWFNNPMGNVYSDDEFESIMKVARQKQITVLVDEAYHYFYPKTFIKYALTEDHPSDILKNMPVCNYKIEVTVEIGYT